MARSIERCAGPDVHKQTGAVCVRGPGRRGHGSSISAPFGTMTSDLLALWD